MAGKVLQIYNSLAYLFLENCDPDEEKSCKNRQRTVRVYSTWTIMKNNKVEA